MGQQVPHIATAIRRQDEHFEKLSAEVINFLAKIGAFFCHNCLRLSFNEGYRQQENKRRDFCDVGFDEGSETIVCLDNLLTGSFSPSVILRLL